MLGRGLNPRPKVSLSYHKDHILYNFCGEKDTSTVYRETIVICMHRTPP